MSGPCGLCAALNLIQPAVVAIAPSLTTSLSMDFTTQYCVLKAIVVYVFVPLRS